MLGSQHSPRLCPGNMYLYVGNQVSQRWTWAWSWLSSWTDHRSHHKGRNLGASREFTVGFKVDEAAMIGAYIPQGLRSSRDRLWSGVLDRSEDPLRSCDEVLYWQGKPLDIVSLRKDALYAVLVKKLDFFYFQILRSWRTMKPPGKPHFPSCRMLIEPKQGPSFRIIRSTHTLSKNVRKTVDIVWLQLLW